MSEPTTTGLQRLREPFEPNQINKLPKPYKSDSAKGQCRECGGYHGMPAVHLDYVGHAALTDRLLDADPNWTWEPLALGPDGLPAFDKDGGLWIKLTICGVTRLGYGDSQGKRGGNAVKEAIGDALRNGGMRFGAALDLWHKGDLHDADEARGTAPAPAAATASGGSRIQQAMGKPARDFLAEAKLAGTDVANLRALWTAADQAGAPRDTLDAIEALAKSAAKPANVPAAV